MKRLTAIITAVLLMACAMLAPAAERQITSVIDLGKDNTITHTWRMPAGTSGKLLSHQIRGLDGKTVAIGHLQAFGPTEVVTNTVAATAGATRVDYPAANVYTNGELVATPVWLGRGDALTFKISATNAAANVRVLLHLLDTSQ